MVGRGGLRGMGEGDGEEFGEVRGRGRRVERRGVVVRVMMIRRRGGFLPGKVNSMKDPLS